MKMIKQLILGQRVKGEKLPKVVPPKERPMNREEFSTWCKEFNVSILYDKKPIHIN
jgi:hypothetical protein